MVLCYGMSSFMNFDFDFYKNIDSRILMGAAVGATVILVLAGYFLYQAFKGSSQVTPQNPQDEVRQLVGEVSKLMELPAGEDPTIATVTDVEQLRAQPFFLNAQNQDKVLIYSNARKAILYRPSTKKVIEVAPINIGTQSAQPATPSALPTP